MIAARWLVLGTLAPVLLATACGSGAMPEPAVCQTPTPVARPDSFARDQPYLSAVSAGVNRLQQLRQQQRSQYPTRSFSRASEFRTAFAEYADESICTATNLRSLAPTAARFADYDSTLDTTLTAFIEHMQFGREAVRKRNVTEYREWYDAIDARLNSVVRAAAAGQR